MIIKIIEKFGESRQAKNTEDTRDRGKGRPDPDYNQYIAIDLAQIDRTPDQISYDKIQIDID